MSSRAGRWRTRMGRMGCGGRCAGLAATIAVSGAMVLPVAFAAGGAAGLWAAGAAAVVCLVGGLAALVLGAWLSESSQPLAGILSSMAARMGVPLVAAMVIYDRGGMLVAGGFIFYLLAFYMITLVAETWMSLGQSAGAGALSEGLETGGGIPPEGLETHG